MQRRAFLSRAVGLWGTAALPLPTRWNGLPRPFRSVADALPLQSPYNFKLGAKNPRKLWGFNILPSSIYWRDPAHGQHENLNWGICWTSANFPGTMAGSWLPQMLLAKSHGASCVRVFGALQGVFGSTVISPTQPTSKPAYTLAQYENAYACVLSAARYIGLWVGGCQGSGGGVIGNTFNTTQIKTGDIDAIPNVTQTGYQNALASLLTNVLEPNRDIVAYQELGLQECYPGDDTAKWGGLYPSQWVAKWAKTAYTNINGITGTLIPLSGSALASVTPGWVWSGFPYIDCQTVHWHFSGSDFASAQNDIAIAMNENYGNQPLLFEETYQVPMADWIDGLGRGLHHPDLAGVLLWAGPSDNAGFYNIYGAEPGDYAGSDATALARFVASWTPATPTSAWEPYLTRPSMLAHLASWTDTAATTRFAAFSAGSPSALTYALSAKSGQSVTATAAPLTLDATGLVNGSEGALGTGTSAFNFLLPLVLRERRTVVFSGTVTWPGSSPLTLALAGTSNTTTISESCGTVTIPAGVTNYAFKISGTIGVNGAKTLSYVRLFAASAAGAILGPLSGTISIGDVAASAPRLPQLRN